MAIKDNTDILHRWKHMSTYCIGPKTESVAKARLDLQHCIGSQCGNAEKLAEKIVLDIKKDSKPLLYPCSHIARETIFNVLTDKRVAVQKIIAYKTLENESLGQNLLEFLKKSSNIFVFFSPSTVEYIANQLKKISYDINAIRAIAIGPTTFDALNNLNFNVYATMEKPEPAALMQVIKAIGKDIKKSTKSNKAS
jgi:uroporphyrinogen-III synthase